MTSVLERGGEVGQGDLGETLREEGRVSTKADISPMQAQASKDGWRPQEDLAVVLEFRRLASCPARGWISGV